MPRPGAALSISTGPGLPGSGGSILSADLEPGTFGLGAEGGRLLGRRLGQPPAYRFASPILEARWGGRDREKLAELRAAKDIHDTLSDFARSIGVRF